MTPEAHDLQPHPEGGWYRETWRTPGTVRTPRGERNLATGVLFLLQPGERSRWHRVAGEELWLWQDGGALELSLGGTGDVPGPATTVRLERGQSHLVQPGQWQAARPAGDEAVLVTCVVSPGFDFADLELAAP